MADSSNPGEGFESYDDLFAQTPGLRTSSQQLSRNEQNMAQHMTRSSMQPALFNPTFSRHAPLGVLPRQRSFGDLQDTPPQLMSLAMPSSPPNTPASGSTWAQKRPRPDENIAAKLKRKNTKRRRTGPNRFDGFLHGDSDLPDDPTTREVFAMYPNHITIDDYEELWRLGMGAIEMSKLMPAETHQNSDGEEVDQHHSHIQKKFRIFAAKRDQRENTTHPPAPSQISYVGPSNSPVSGQPILPSTRDDRTPSSTTAVASTQPASQLRFRCYPFQTGEDQAFEARMSIELTKAGAPPEDEVGVLRSLINGELRRHTNLVERNNNLRPSIPSRIPREWLDRRYAYDKVSRELALKWGLRSVLTTDPREALNQLFRILATIFQNNEFKASAIKGKQRLFNFEHKNLVVWRAHARLLYYLTRITKTLTSNPVIEPPSGAEPSIQQTGSLRRRLLPQAQSHHLNDRSPSLSMSQARIDVGVIALAVPLSNYGTSGRHIGDADRDFSLQVQSRDDTYLSYPQSSLRAEFGIDPSLLKPSPSDYGNFGQQMVNAAGMHSPQTSPFNSSSVQTMPQARIDVSPETSFNLRQMHPDNPHLEDFGGQRHGRAPLTPLYQHQGSLLTNASNSPSVSARATSAIAGPQRTSAATVETSARTSGIASSDGYASVPETSARAAENEFVESRLEVDLSREAPANPHENQPPGVSILVDGLSMTGPDQQKEAFETALPLNEFPGDGIAFGEWPDNTLMAWGEGDFLGIWDMQGEDQHDDDQQAEEPVVADRPGEGQGIEDADESEFDVMNIAMKMASESSDGVVRDNL